MQEFFEKYPISLIIKLAFLKKESLIIQILSDLVNNVQWNFTKSGLTKNVRSLQIVSKRVRKFGLKEGFSLCCGLILRQIHYLSMKIIGFTTFTDGNFTLIWFLCNRFFY